MSGQQRLFPTDSSIAYDRYGRDLSQALRSRSWIHDPSFALGVDDMVYEKIRRDAVTAQAITYRKHLVTGRGIVIEPAADDDASKQAALILEELLDQLGMFTDGRFNLSEAIFRGSAYAFIQGQQQQLSLGDGAPMDWWVPRKLVDVDRRRFRLAPIPTDVPGEIQVEWLFWSVERQVWELLEHPEWFVRHFYQRTEDTLNYGRGLLDALHFYQSSKMRVLQEGLSAAERFGQGFITVGVDSLRPGAEEAESNAKIAEAYLTALDTHRARNAFVHAKEDTVDVLGGFGEGWQLIKELLAHLDNAIRTLVLGSNLPTSATSGGSFALAEIQENSTEALVQFDRELLSETLTRDLVGLTWALNLDNLRAMGLGGARMPRLRIRQEKREDPQINAAVIAQALASGIPLRRDEVYDKLGFTQPQEGDEVIEGQAAAALDPLAPLGAPPAPRELRSLGLDLGGGVIDPKHLPLSMRLPVNGHG